MNNEFDLVKWNTIKVELKKRYPQLTDADLIWRHETKEYLFGMIASELKMTRNELEEIIENF